MTDRKMKSARPDGRGHWPGGKRRNVDRGNWQRVRLSLVRFLDDYWCMGSVTANALAKDLGVSERAVRRWLSGEDRPAPQLQEAVEQWLVEKRDRQKQSTAGTAVRQ